MRVPLKWLRRYVDLPQEAKVIADALTMTGTKAETIEFIGEEIKRVVVGRVDAIEAHPSADKLVVTKTNIGEEILQIVTGATNLKVGDYIPVAVNGSRLPGGIKIKRGNLRGVESNGMLCSAQELGIESKFVPEALRDGIYVLSQSYPLGMDIHEAMLLQDAIIDFEITANRPDCLCMLGIAREAAATFDKELKLPSLQLQESPEMMSFQARVEDEDLCPRYMMKEVVDIHIAPSPDWMQRYLIEADVRPINNIVDITNYVMLEYGQPLHAFDREELDTGEIVVRRAKDQEVFTTLDRVERKMDSSMLMITDGKKSVGIAGVMGGENSQITEKTKHMVLESATFHADNIRKTSKVLGLRTEASSRFEKGIDIKRAEEALLRACHLIEELGCGRVLKGAVDTMKEQPLQKVICVQPQRVAQLIGLAISPEEMMGLLERVHFTCTLEEGMLKVAVPSYRLDMEDFEDVVEEVARIYGFENIPSTPIFGETTAATKSQDRLFEDAVKSAAMGRGFTEVCTYSFVSPGGIGRCRLTQERYSQFAKLLNPLGEETSVMRTTLVPGMMDVLSTNVSRKVENFAAFEYGNTFFVVAATEKNGDFQEEQDSAQEEPQAFKGEQPWRSIEEKAFVAGLYGEEEDFFTMKNRVQGMLLDLGIRDVDWVPEKSQELYHPGRCAALYLRTHSKDVLLGYVGEVHPQVLEEYDLKKRMQLCQLFVPALQSCAGGAILYKSIPKYPAITRDLALVVDRDLYVSQVEKIIRREGKKLLEDVKLFDIYTGDRIDPSKKSVAYALAYRAKDRTLMDEEVNEIQAKILAALETEVGAVLRS